MPRKSRLKSYMIEIKNSDGTTVTVEVFAQSEKYMDKKLKKQYGDDVQYSMISEEPYIQRD